MLNARLVKLLVTFKKKDDKKEQSFYEFYVLVGNVACRIKPNEYKKDDSFHSNYQTLKLMADTITAEQLEGYNKAY